MKIKTGSLHCGSPQYKSEWNLKNVKAVVNNIIAVQGDFETAHSMEDELYAHVLNEVVAGNPEVKEMALVALRTKEIDFPRYCA